MLDERFQPVFLQGHSQAYFFTIKALSADSKVLTDDEILEDSVHRHIPWGVPEPVDQTEPVRQPHTACAAAFQVPREQTVVLQEWSALVEK